MVAKVSISNAPVPNKDGPRVSAIFSGLSSSGRMSGVVPIDAINFRRGARNNENISFQDSFGVLGIPLLIIVLGCIIWTLWLIILSIAPNDAANFLMNTKELDNGQFWLIPDEWSILQSFSMAGLGLVLLFYLYILLKMLVWRSQKNLLEKKLQACQSYWRTQARAKVSGSLGTICAQRLFQRTWRLYVKWVALTHIHGENRKYWNLFQKVQDLVMLAMLLRDLLEGGTPVCIVYGFASMAALNSLSVASSILLNRSTALVEVIVDSLFDFCSTVIYPLTVLYYCRENFHYDRAVYAINLEIMPVGSFERRARMYANPAEIALVHTFFDSLRILDSIDFVLRIGMNLAFSYRIKRIVEVLIEMGVENQLQDPTKKLSLLHHPKRSPSAEKLIARQRSVPKPLAAFFIVYSIGVLVVTRKAIVTSQVVCSPHPQCVVYAYRWHTTGICPCRAIIDGDPAPLTYYEWTNPVDVTNMVSSLAAAGTLETLQLINRQLTVLPIALRGCHNLNFMSLINCATVRLPPWLKELRHLQYLQIEGKVGSDNLGNLDADLFSGMADLRYLQLGVHQHMLRLPPFDGAPKLRSILLSRLYNLDELPSMTHLTHLERLEMGALKSLPFLPDLRSVKSLHILIILQGAPLCCNGFLGSCNLSNPYCTNSTCLANPAEKATTSTLDYIQYFSYSVCQPYSGLSQTPTTQTIQMCDGIPFSECNFPDGQQESSVIGMCYNHRMQVLACNPDPDKIRVRRRQIQENVGKPCDPAHEAWLGCKGTTI